MSRSLERWIVVIAVMAPLLVLSVALLTALADDDLTAIHDIQFTLDPAGDSPYAGQTIQTAGIVTAIYRDGYVIAEPAGGPWSGVYVYDPDHLPATGDYIRITADVSEYYGLTELVDVGTYFLESDDNPLPAPAVTSCTVAGSEPYEGVLISAGPVTVAEPALGFGEWLIADASGTLRVHDKNDLWYIPRMGDALAFVRGIIFYSYGQYGLAPRDDPDLGTPASVPFTLRGTIVTPDVVIPDGCVTIRGQWIEAVGEDPPAGVSIIQTNSLIFPGLINAHDHPQYNMFPTLRFGRKFDNRYEWQSSLTYQHFRERVNAVTNAGLACEMWKYVEIRALLAGNTTQQGAFRSDYWDCYAHPRVLVRNPERVNRAIRDEVLPLDLSEASRATIRSRVENGAYRSLLIHLSEGIDAASLTEFDAWQSWGLLPASVIIHGIPYGPAEFTAIREAGASLVWSPQSNLHLYGHTADPTAAMDQGVLVSLAPDWCPSGSYDILRELRVADRLNREQFGGRLSDENLVRMVTVNPAIQLDLDGRLGRLAPGFLADLIVIEGDTGSPYRALVDARARDVRLVLIGGEALYGEADLMIALNGEKAGEPINVCGRSRRIRVALDAPGISKSKQSLQEVIDSLLAVEPGALPLDPCRAYRQWLPYIQRSSAN